MTSRPSKTSRKKKRRWRVLPEGKPGDRFEQRYEAGRGQRKSPWSRVLSIGGASVLLAVGAFFTAVPGPGIPFLLAGAGLLATQSRGVARLLDRLEVRIRAWAGALAKGWKRASLPARVGVVGTAGALTVGGAFVAWRMLFAD